MTLVPIGTTMACWTDNPFANNDAAVTVQVEHSESNNQRAKAKLSQLTSALLSLVPLANLRHLIKAAGPRLDASCWRLAITRRLTFARFTGVWGADIESR